MKNFVSIETVISRILLEIGDEDHKRYYVRAAQWALDVFRRLNVSYSPFYIERKATLDNIYSFDIPKDSVKILSVGVYRNGEFWPFTKKPDMSLMPPDIEDNIYVPDDSEGRSILQKGGKYGRNPGNFGYWMEDPEHCRVFVRNFRFSNADGATVDNTSNISDKVIVRYKTTGIDCQGEICVPTEMQDLVVETVNYKFAQKGIPSRYSADTLDRMERTVSSLQEEYEALMYEPHNFWEVRDAIFGSLNTTARR